LHNLIRERDSKADYINNMRSQIERARQEAQLLEQELSYAN